MPLRSVTSRAFSTKPPTAGSPRRSVIEVSIVRQSSIPLRNVNSNSAGLPMVLGAPSLSWWSQSTLLSRKTSEMDRPSRLSGSAPSAWSTEGLA